MLKLLLDAQEDWNGRPTTFAQLRTHEELHPRTSENIESFPWTSLTSIGCTSSEHRTSDKCCDTSNTKPWRHRTSEKNWRRIFSFTSYLRMHTLKVPNVRNNSRKFLDLTAYIRTQEIGLPDVRHYQRLLDSSTTVYPLKALIEELFDPI